MSSTLTLRNGQQEYQLCRDLTDCQSMGRGATATLSLLDPIAAVHFLREVITDSGQQHDLRLWLLDYISSFEMFAIDNDRLIEYAANLIASGQLVIAGQSAAEGAGEVEGSAGSTQGILRKGAAKSVLLSHVETTPLQDEMASKDAVSEEAATADEDSTAAADTTWIEIELIDPNGNPVPGERYKITMPDGSIKYGRLDDNAKARIEKLQPGTCQVTFPDRDQEVWEVG
jgi:hypothetical protein